MWCHTTSVCFLFLHYFSSLMPSKWIHIITNSKIVFIYNKSFTYEPSSCEFSKMWMCCSHVESHVSSHDWCTLCVCILYKWLCFWYSTEQYLYFKDFQRQVYKQCWFWRTLQILSIDFHLPTLVWWMEIHDAMKKITAGTSSSIEMSFSSLCGWYPCPSQSDVLLGHVKGEEGATVLSLFCCAWVTLILQKGVEKHV